jgi:6-phosphogluconolactonase
MDRASRWRVRLLVACLTAVACAGARTREPAPAEQKPAGPPPKPVPFVYVSGYRPEIQVFRLLPATGRLEPLSTVAAGKDPSFLAIHPGRHFLYAVNEVDEGTVTAFAIDQTNGALVRLNQQPSAGVGPVHVAIDRSGRFALVANYAGKKAGSVAVLPIGADGLLGVAVDTEVFARGSMPHLVTTDPGNRFVFVPCKGGPFVAELRFSAANGQLAPNRPDRIAAPPKSGPRHMDFHPEGRFAYVINEEALTVTAYRFDQNRGTLAETQSISSLPVEAGDRRTFSGADLHVHPSGRFLYASNRGHNSLVIFRIDPASGRLTLVGHETRSIAMPRNFHIDPEGKLLLAANQAAGNVTVFRIDASTGLLEPAGFPAEAGSNPSFVGVVLLPGR